jgi:hypothetical protein
MFRTKCATISPTWTLSWTFAAHPPDRSGFGQTDRTKRMNPTLLFFELTNALRQRKVTNIPPFVR